MQTLTRPSSGSDSVSSMRDPRNRDYAELLVGTCLGVQAGWQVLVLGTELGRPLLEEYSARSPVAAPTRSPS